MNILLIYPEFPDTFWSFKHALAFVGKRATLPPLGLLTVAALLPEGWSKRLVDTNVSKLTQNDLDWADFAFISAMGVQRNSALRIMRQCRAAGVPIVAGGPLFQSEQEHVDEADYFILNEAELTLPPFLADLAQGQPKHIYTTEKFADMRHTPAPDWKLLNMQRYACMSVQFSRGCPFNCDFCNVTALLGRRMRTKSAAQIIAELDGLFKLGWRQEIFFVDDNFIGNKAFLKTDLLPALIAWRKDKPGISFFTEASINLADDRDLMQLMVSAGFRRVFIGIETPDEASLAECSKHQNQNRNLLEDIKLIQRMGLEVQGGFIVGFDHDHPSIFQRQIEFIQKSGIVTAMVGLLQAPPGTRLYERMKLESRLRGESSGDNVDGTTNIIPVMNLEALKDGYKSILRHIYAPANYYARIRTFLREYNPPTLQGRFHFTNLLALFRSIYRLGIVGKERLHYWKLLFWVQFRRPHLIPEAVMLAIYGYHFRTLCEKNVV